MDREPGPLGRIFSPAQVRWGEVDWHVLLVALILLGIGLTFQWAMDEAEGEALRLAGGVNFAGHRQKVLLTLPLIIVGMITRPTWLRRHAGTIYAGCIALLVAVIFVGDERNNARRWIDLRAFDLQPSELAKIGLVLVLARILASNRLESPGQWVLPLAAAGLPMLLVAGQPDLGTAMTMVPVTLGMFYLAGARARHLTGLVMAGVLLAGAASQLGMVQEYQWKRIETWAATYEPEGLLAVKTGSGYHMYHSRTPIGNGGMWGQGLGNGVANGAGLLPERDSDSVFAVIAEEGGFFGAAGVLVIYTLLVLLLMSSAARLRDRFGRLVLGGIAIYFAAHVFIHVSTNIGLLPMTGLTLPLISTGGSSLLATFWALGLALGLGSYHETRLDSDAFRSF